MHNAIILASFGSADDLIRKNIFDTLAAEISCEFPTFEVRQAFTSQFMIGKLKKRGILMKTPAEMIISLRGEGFSRIILLPTHLTAGEEFENKILPCKTSDVEIIAPILSEPLDLSILDMIFQCFKPLNEELVLIGHGSPHKHNPVYEKIQQMAGERVHIGVIEENDTPNFADVACRLKKSRADKILLAPLLFNGGIHVEREISCDWREKFIDLGYKVRVIREGLGSFEDFRAFYIKKLRKVI